jgi:hypothetical protein
MSKIQDMLEKKKIVDEELLMLMSKISENEKIYENFKKEIILQKRIELSRISKEFLTNDFERRYNITQDIVVSAICGEDNMNQELSKVMREQKVKNYFNSIKLNFYIKLLII